MLEIENLNVRYGAIQALHGVNLRVEPGKIVTLIGANGAGKTTTLKAASGLIRSCGGAVRFAGEEITNQPAHVLVSKGLCHVPEGRMVFSSLTVEENLKMGAYLRKNRFEINDDFDKIFHMFPRLKERLKQNASTLSGGEQQMLAIGRALMSRPRFLMLDEPSLGIAPLLVKSIFEKIVTISREENLPILLVEQNANLALEISSYAYVLETGSVILSGPSEEIRANPKVREAYLGH